MVAAYPFSASNTNTTGNALAVIIKLSSDVRSYSAISFASANYLILICSVPRSLTTDYHFERSERSHEMGDETGFTVAILISYRTAVSMIKAFLTGTERASK